MICWGLGAERIGHTHPLDFVRCRHCHRRAPLPAWFGDEAECQSCLTKRHSNCPCDQATKRPSDPPDHATMRPVPLDP